MPEGDTILRHAQILAPRLVGKSIALVTTQGLDRDLSGRTVTAVIPHGKHLMIDLDDGTRIRTHLGMNGRIRTYDGPPPRASPGDMRLVIALADGTCAVWFRAPTVEILARRAAFRDAALARLGPDVLDVDFDPADAAARAAGDPRPIAEVLLDQRVVAGIGNIYKNESLWERQISPRTPARDLGAAALRELFVVAHERMSRRDRTRHVYQRTGEPCPRCATKVVRAELFGRATWWCPCCQPEAPGSEAGDDR